MEFSTERRRLIGAGMLIAGASVAASRSVKAKGEGQDSGAWSARPEKPDSWLDKAGTRHRICFDSVSPDGGAQALGFANNFIKENELGYNLTPDQLGVVVILRHYATPLSYNDAIWAKYGKGFAEKLGMKGEMAKRAATMNPVLASSAAGPPPPGFAWFADDNLNALTAKGVRYAVCGLATQVIAGILAGKTGDAKAIDAELRANLVPGAVIVPAGIVAVDRCQERGYSYTYVG